MKRNDFNPELREEVAFQPAIGLLELSSVARGIEVTDAVLWEASVEMLFATPVQPGKYVLLFTGSVQDVEASVRRGAEVAQTDLVDQLLIPQVHPQIPPRLQLTPKLRQGEGRLNGQPDAIGVVETTTVASAVLSCDAALKTSTVDLIDIRLANGLGGKSFYTLTGEVSDVRSAVARGAELARERGLLARQIVVPRPHPDLKDHLL